MAVCWSAKRKRVRSAHGLKPAYMAPVWIKTQGMKHRAMCRLGQQGPMTLARLNTHPVVITQIKPVRHFYWRPIPPPRERGDQI